MISVNIENLFSTILDLHYIRNSLYDHSKLEKSAEYIEKKFQEIGLQCNSQSFNIERSDSEFKNVIATYNPGKSKELIISSHYDHIHNSFGADDNLSGVSVMLEAARIISKLELDISVKFVCFTLEEEHSGYTKAIRDKQKELGLTNSEGFPALNGYKKFFQMLQIEFNSLIRGGNSIANSIEQITNNFSENLDQNEKNYLYYLKEIYLEAEKNNYHLNIGLIGSSVYVEAYKSALSKTIGVINLETCGYTSKEKNSQKIISGIDFSQFPRNSVEDLTIGNFILIIADKYSMELGSTFFEKTKGILPSVFSGVPFNYEEIKKVAFDLLRSDNSSFWKEHIPALMITDTANFRNPYYHTPADTIEKLDFEFMEKLTTVVVNSVLEYNKTP